jgi:isopentenyl-diphosphate delta-isomerase
VDEILDLVNEKDEVIGEVEKDIANDDLKLFHREILVYIFDDHNRMLAQQRSFKKKVYPGSWAETCAGHIGRGEDPEVAAHRELFEEFGFDVKLKFIAKRLIEYPNETHFAYCFTGRYDGSKITFQKEEIEQIKFVIKDEFEKLFKEKNDKTIEKENAWIKKVWRQQKSP